MLAKWKMSVTELADKVGITMANISVLKMRKCKLAILAIAVLLQVHTGASCLFAQVPQAPQAEPIT